MTPSTTPRALSAIKADLLVSGSTTVTAPDGRVWLVELTRATDWQGQPYWNHYALLLALSRVWRAVRRDNRWLVSAIDQDHVAAESQAIEVVGSREVAIEAAANQAHRRTTGSTT